MKKRKSTFTAAEKEAYRRGKIIAYYQARRKAKRKSAVACSDVTSDNSRVKYGNYDPKEAFRAALERSYGAKQDGKR